MVARFTLRNELSSSSKDGGHRFIIVCANLDRVLSFKRFLLRLSKCAFSRSSRTPICIKRINCFLIIGFNTLKIQWLQLFDFIKCHNVCDPRRTVPYQVDVEVLLHFLEGLLVKRFRQLLISTLINILLLFLSK